VVASDAPGREQLGGRGSGPAGGEHGLDGQAQAHALGVQRSVDVHTSHLYPGVAEPQGQHITGPEVRQVGGGRLQLPR